MSTGRSTTSRTPWTPGSCAAPTAATTSRRSTSTCSRCRRSRCASRRAFDFGDGRFTFDPSGRDIQLFQPRQRPEEGDPCHGVREWELPAPLTCRRLNAARLRLERDDLPGDLVAELGAWAGLEYRTETAFRRLLDDRLNAAQLTLHLSELLEAALTLDSPKFHLWPAAVSVAVADNAGADPFLRHEVLGADLETWGSGLTVETDRRLLVDPARGRFMLLGAFDATDRVFAQHYHFGLTNPVGAGPFDHAADLSPDSEVTGTLPSGPVNADGFFTDPGPVTGVVLPTTGVHRVPSSKTYEPDPGRPDLERSVRSGSRRALTRRARSGSAPPPRPYLRFTPPAADPTITIEAAARRPAGPGAGRALARHPAA